MKQQSLTILYDGECPFCSRYVEYYRLGEVDIDVRMTDIRNKPDKIAAFHAQGFNLDEGMIVVMDDAVYHGTEAVHILALLSSSVGTFNRLNRWIFSRRWLATPIYPILVCCRNLVLFLLGRKKINAN